MLKLKLQYFGQLMRRADSFEKTLMVGGIGGRRRVPWPLQPSLSIPSPEGLVVAGEVGETS